MKSNVSSKNKTIYRHEYQVPPFLIETVDLQFVIGEDSTVVTSQLALQRNPAAQSTPQELFLNGEDLECLSVKINQAELLKGAYEVLTDGLRLLSVPDQFQLSIVTKINPKANTVLMGLYQSNQLYCTQCEAQGFRRITYYLDRPDVMAIFTTRIIADKKRCPILLSNGNLIASQDLSDGRHEVVWNDPFPKPCHLFALVAGDLAEHVDYFTTCSGRHVTLKIFVDKDHADRTAHTMNAIKMAMRWDEDAFGREYDLDIFMLVAVDDFNMGAMENKGLNVFNTKYALANPMTATDSDFYNIVTVVGHEYFHNWTGNRVNCRDWFQLTLKEGLTVYRDQEFTADLFQRGVKRISDVIKLRSAQFPQDAGPLAHPIRPDSYIEINNFYTVTIYEKGSEVIRMMATLLGREGFRRGMDLYFSRHDGYAVTCEDFVKALEDANGVDFSQFRLWYEQAGTPFVSFTEEYDATAKTFKLKIKQTMKPTPGQSTKRAMHIPLRLALLAPDGNEMPLILNGQALPHDETVLSLTQESEIFVFNQLSHKPVPSLFRGFSAPVNYEYAYSDEELSFLFSHDHDDYACWQAGQILATRILMRMVQDFRQHKTPSVSSYFIDACRHLLHDTRWDKAFVALALQLPSEILLAEAMTEIDSDAIHHCREIFLNTIANQLTSEWWDCYEQNHSHGPFHFDANSAAKRSLQGLALNYLVRSSDVKALEVCRTQYHKADNMTDRFAVLQALMHSHHPVKIEIYDHFYHAWRNDALVLDKWFALQAMSNLPDTLHRVKTLLKDSAYRPKNPNCIRALIGSFAVNNPYHFHAADGTGYTFVADEMIQLDKLNPQTAARVIEPLTRWQRHDLKRQAAMQKELTRILKQPDLSKDMFEVVSKSLKETME